MYRVPNLPSWYSIKHFIRSRNIFHSKCGAAGSCLGIEWPYHIPHYPKAAGLTERWNGLLKTQCSTSWDIRPWNNGVNNVLHVHYIPWISHEDVSLVAKWTRLESKEWMWKYSSTTKTINTLTRLLLFFCLLFVCYCCFSIPILVSFNSPSLEVLDPNGGILSLNNSIKF